MPTTSSPTWAATRCAPAARARSTSVATGHRGARPGSPRASTASRSGELQRRDLPTVTDQLEARGHRARALAVAHVQADLGAAFGDEAGVSCDQLGSHGLDAAAAGTSPDRSSHQVGPSGEVLVDLGR